MRFERSSLNVHRQTIYFIPFGCLREHLKCSPPNKTMAFGKYFSSQQLFSWLINRVCAPIYSQPIKAQSECEYHFRVSYSSNWMSRPIRPKSRRKTKRTYFRAFSIPNHSGFFFFWFLKSISKQKAGVNRAPQMILFFTASRCPLSLVTKKRFYPFV